ncbi:hypothetical protein [Streptosporangium sp. NPDC003464]
MKSDAPWWILERRAAHGADVESVPGRGRSVPTPLPLLRLPAASSVPLGPGAPAPLSFPRLPEGRA